MQKKLRQEFKVSFIWWYTLLYMSNGTLSGCAMRVFFSLPLSRIPLEMWVSFDSRQSLKNGDALCHQSKHVSTLKIRISETVKSISFEQCSSNSPRILFFLFVFFFFVVLTWAFFLSATLSKEWNSLTIKQELYNTTARKKLKCVTTGTAEGCFNSYKERKTRPIAQNMSQK